MKTIQAKKKRIRNKLFDCICNIFTHNALVSRAPEIRLFTVLNVMGINFLRYFSNIVPFLIYD
jgi:hypothetical protein